MTNRGDQVKDITHHDYKFWADAADNLIKGLPKLLSAIKTLENKGYTYQGGELWKPPLGKKPDFSLIDSQNERIKELELQSNINEIKAQVIEEFIDNHPPYERPMGTLDDGTMVSWYCYNIGHLTDYIKKLRNKHE